MRLEEQLLELDVVKEEIARYTSFSLGKRRILNLEARYDKLYLKWQLQLSKEALAYVYHYGDLTFGGIKDISLALNDAKRNMCLTPQELREIADEIRGVEGIVKAFNNCELECIYLKELVDSFAIETSLAQNIEKAISLQYEVLDSASPTLKSIRRNIKNMQQEISKEASNFMANNANLLMDQITTLRGNRCCVLVKVSEKNKVDGILHGESSSKQSAYIEPKALMHLNNHLESLYAQEKEEIHRILMDLSKQVKLHAHALEMNLDTLGILDELFAKAKWGKEYNCCIADLDETSKHFYLKQARHPLIDQNKVVANTYELQGEKRILLISGSNTGGKSVALKTMGLFAMLTFCGIPLPCDEAIIPLFDHIYVGIGDEQSIQESLSTFSASISKIALILKQATINSFVLLDEIGNGTDPKEGEALALAILERLESIGCMAVTTTHFSALKSYGASSDYILSACVEFDLDKLAPTYRYLEGISQSSYAFLIAKRYGVDDLILNRAKQIKDDHAKEDEVVLEKLQQQQALLQIKLDEVTKQLADIEAQKEKLAAKQLKFEQQKQHVINELKAKQEKALAEKLAEAQMIIDELKTKNDSKPHERIALKKAMDDLVYEEEKVEINETFNIGDYVCIKSLNYYGVIESLKKDSAQILCNGMKMKAKLSDLIHAKKQVPNKPKVKKGHDIKVRSFSMECNLIGLRVDEAKQVLDKYIDDALMAKVYQVRVIHGFGSGKLRAGVHVFLKNHPNVDSFVFAPSNQGGLGATEVKLKHKGK